MAAIGGLITAIVGIPIAAFAAMPFFRAKTPMRLISDAVAPTLRSDEWTSAGAVDDFDVGVPRLVPLQRQVTDGWTTETATVAVYIVRETETDFVAFDIHCTHLGCPLAFSSGAGQFVCPCHGGTFSVEGQVTGGPPPRPMLRYETRVVDGEVQVGRLQEGA
jgi:menaquinol-cytochrome c reductase iron-sulfur subunit